ncbi:MAG: hypothetical protein ACK4YP_22090 [Myxococcota bacterium]
MGQGEDDPKIRKGGPAPIPSNEPIAESVREHRAERGRDEGLAREKAGREGRNDEYLDNDSFAPRAQHSHGGPGESKQAGGDASSGVDRTPNASKGNRRS